MNRKQFLKRLGLLFGAAIVAPSLLAETKEKPKQIFLHHTAKSKPLVEWGNEFTITVQNTSNKVVGIVSVTGFDRNNEHYSDIIYKVNGNIVTQNAIKRVFSTPTIFENVTIKQDKTDIGYGLLSWDDSSESYNPKSVYKPIFSNNRYDFILNHCSALIIDKLPPNAIVDFTFKVKAKREPMLIINGCKGIGKSYGPHDFHKFKNL